MKEERNKRLFVTLGSGLAFGLLAHLFGMVNMLQSSDSLTAIWGTGAGLSSGRWMLEIINNFLSDYWPIWNLGFYNNLLALIFIALSAYLIVEIFDIDDLRLCAALGGIMTCFPAVNATLLYGFAAVHYGAAVFMTVLGVRLTEKYKFGFIAGAILAAVSMGIYQAYFPIMIILFLALLIVRALEGSSQGWNLLKRAFFYLGTLVLSLLIYFVVLKIMLAATGTELSGYQGISGMEAISLKELPYRFIVAYKDFLRMLPNSNQPIFGTGFVMLAFNILSLICLAEIVFIMIKERKRVFRQDKALLILFLILYPLGLYSIKLMCFYSEIHEVMIYSLSMIYLLPVLVCHKLKKFLGSEKQKRGYRILRNISAALLCLICLNYSLQSNAVYSKVYFERLQTQSYWAGVLSRIQAEEEFDPELDWAFLGTPVDVMRENPWDEVPYTNVGSNGYDLKYYESYLKVQLGYDIDFADPETMEKIVENEAVGDMGTYPAKDSIAVIDNVLVVKFS